MLSTTLQAGSIHRNAIQALERGHRERWFFWLSGPAGAGKSAIIQSVAEGCVERNLPMASCFFRADPTRNRVRPLVATIVYQMIAVYPDLKGVITSVIENDPLLFGLSLEDQFDQLIVRPLHTMRLSPTERLNPFVIFIDGLDECDSDAKTEQITVIRVLQDIIQRGDPPFIVLIASRPEAHITLAFNRTDRSALNSLFLDESYRPSADIRRIVKSKFSEIASTHHLAHAVPPGWPPESNVEDIVNKSSGQFIYASTVMRFIAFSPMSPAHSLDIIRGLRLTQIFSPFSALDAIYSYILSRANNLDAVKDILSAHHSLEGVESYLSDLLAIARFDLPTEAVVFYHASLEDYLVDTNRSGAYHIDLETFPTRVATATILTPSSIPDLSRRLLVVNNLLQTINAPSAQLTKALSPLSPFFLCYDKTAGFTLSAPEFTMLCSRIKNIYASGDVGVHGSLLRLWLKWAREVDKGISLTEADLRPRVMPYVMDVLEKLRYSYLPAPSALAHPLDESTTQTPSRERISRAHVSNEGDGDGTYPLNGEQKISQESPSKRRRWWTGKRSKQSIEAVLSVPHI
ncbi:hypothetical protein D9619_013513 [Psilocybe cf. subviscida]|uniref:Nephrocystin 3-like N-terminal domain-containing protein n=1 Tax=Psilocybe cf. subviscida TaxID=2480587 RepID=A0A8H5F4I4_9AGAR|nr:hypothetical protein D9619_013513 [Psilocybe cf. subviscida]